MFIYFFLCAYLPNHFENGRMRKSVFKSSKNALSSEFFLFFTGCLTKVKETSLFNYFLVVGEEYIETCLFQKHLPELKLKQLHPGFKQGSPITFTVKITITTISVFIYICMAIISVDIFMPIFITLVLYVI